MLLKEKKSSSHLVLYYEHVVINKSISLVGENKETTIINGNGTGNVLTITSPNVTVSGFTMKNGESGVEILSSYNCTIFGNIVSGNRARGVLLTKSSRCVVKSNMVYDTRNGYGINCNSSSNILIEENQANDNYFDGIGLLSSRNCSVLGNNVENNTIFGLWIDTSNNSRIVHNNILENGVQMSSNSGPNFWNNSIEGNFWSNYIGIDHDRDGIGDQPFQIDASNIDYHPLMGTFSSFNTSIGYDVNLVSNSTIKNLRYSQENNTIRIEVSNTTMSQTFGFCRVQIPLQILDGSLMVTIDGDEPLYTNILLLEDGENRWIYFNYTHSLRTVIIIPEFKTLILLLLIIMVTTMLLIFKTKLLCEVKTRA